MPMYEAILTDPPAWAPDHQHTLNAPDTAEAVVPLGDLRGGRASEPTHRVLPTDNHIQREESSGVPAEQTPPPGRPPGFADIRLDHCPEPPHELAQEVP